MDSGQWGDGVRPVALFGRRCDPRSPFLREWEVRLTERGEWRAWLPVPHVGELVHHGTWRAALAAVRAAEALGQRCHDARPREAVEQLCAAYEEATHD